MHVNTLAVSTLLGVASNLNNFGTGMTYTAPRFPPRWHGIVWTVVSCLVFLFGGVLSGTLLHALPSSLCKTVGTAVLSVVGGWVLLQGMLDHMSHQERTTHIAFDELMLMVMAQTLTDLLLGLGAGFSGLSLWTAVISIGICGLFLVLFARSLGGHRTVINLIHTATISAGMLLLFVGMAGTAIVT